MIFLCNRSGVTKLSYGLQIRGFVSMKHKLLYICLNFQRIIWNGLKINLFAVSIVIENDLFFNRTVVIVDAV